MEKAEIRVWVTRATKAEGICRKKGSYIENGTPEVCVGFRQDPQVLVQSLGYVPRVRPSKVYQRAFVRSLRVNSLQVQQCGGPLERPSSQASSGNTRKAGP